MIPSVAVAIFTLNFFGYKLHIDLWSIFGIVVFNGLFTGRVLVQWVASERRRESVVPVAFWWMSVGGSMAGLMYSYHRQETPLMIGFASTLVPYIRNLAIHYRPHRPPRSSAVIVPIAVLLGCTLLLGQWSEQSMLRTSSVDNINLKLRAGNAVVLANGWKLVEGPESGSLRIVEPRVPTMAGSLGPEAFGAKLTGKGAWIIPAGPDRDAHVAKLLGASPPLSLIRGIWFYVMLIGTAIFFSRFFIQWVQSEKQRKSEMPMSFWVASFIGSLILLAYGFKIRDLPYILSFLFNIIPYIRNMMLIKGQRPAQADELP